MYKNIAKNIHTLVPWVKQASLTQPIITSANKCFIYNKNKQIVDFTSGLMVVNLGHNNKYIKKGFNQYMSRGISFVTPGTFSTYERDKLSGRICDAVDFQNGKVFYTNGGADANEVALFIGNNYTGKNKTVSFKHSFHGGSSIASSIISGDTRSLKKTEYYDLPLLPIIENPSMADSGEKTIKQIDNLFSKDKSIGSFILEGSSGSAGCLLYPENFLVKVRKLCTEHNILLICDEVMSGWGRTGELFAFEKEKDFVPDIITTAKGITSGYAQLGAVIINEKIANIYNDLPILTGLTYFGHPLACTIANRCLDLYLLDDKKLIKNTVCKTDLIRCLMENLVDECDIVKEYRTNGLLGCIELKRNDSEMLSSINNKFLDNGIYCYMRENRIFVAPPLIIKDELIYSTVTKMHKIRMTYNN